MGRQDTITVTLEEPLNDEYVAALCQAIELLDGVADSEPGKVNEMDLHVAKQQLRSDVFEAWKEVFDC